MSSLEQIRFRYEFSALRVQVKLLRLIFLLRKANFNPNQPRVPAGNPDGGQWTKVPGWGGGSLVDEMGDKPDRQQERKPSAGKVEEPIHSLRPGDPHEDGESKPERIRVAQVHRDPGFYYFDLEEVYQRGDGHAYPRHVGRSDIELLAEVVGSEHEILGADGNVEVKYHPAEGSFTDLASASDFVAQVLRNHPDAVESVVLGVVEHLVIIQRFGYATGREAYLAEPFGEAIIRPTYSVQVIISFDPKRNSRGYRVITAYPMNEQPNEVFR